MKKFLYLVLAAIVGCSAPPKDMPSERDMLAMFQKNAPAPIAFSTLAVETPLSEQTYTLRQCSVTLRGHLAAAMTGDRWVVKVPQAGAEILAYSGGPGGSGATLDLPGSDSHGDEAAGYVPAHRRQVSLPRRVYAGESLIVWSGAENPGSRGDYVWQAGGRPSSTDQAMPVVFVSWTPTPDHLGPPALGGIGFWPVFFRGEGILKSQLRVDLLPRVIDPADLQGVPLAYVEGLFSRFSGDCYGGWATDQWTPDHQHPGYGRDVASSTSLAMLWLCANIPNEQKRRLAEAVAQWGFDLLGAYSDSPPRHADVDGGHQCGRKAHVVVLGKLLGIEAISYISTFMGPNFQEDRACHLLPNGAGWWWNPDWKVTHSYKDKVADLNGDCVTMPPSQWSGPNASAGGTQKWAVQGYTNPWAGTQIGTALAMKLMGLQEAWSPLGYRYIQQWMTPVPQAVLDQLSAASVRMDFGKDMSIFLGAGVQEKCWRKY